MKRRHRRAELDRDQDRASKPSTSGCRRAQTRTYEHTGSTRDLPQFFEPDDRFGQGGAGYT